MPELSTMKQDEVQLSSEELELLSLWQAVRKWPRVTLYCLALSMNLLLWGYDTGLIGTVSSMPEFQKVFGASDQGQYIIPQPWFSLFDIAFPVGSMIGAAAGGWLQDIAGRRSTLGLGGILSIASIATCYMSDIAAHPGSAFFGGKLFEGVAVGMIVCSTQTYMSEIVPPRLRGPAFALFPAIQMFGQLAASLIVLGLLHVPGQASYRIAIAIQWPFSFVPLLLAFCIPESPSWLLQRDEYAKALTSFQQIHCSKKSAENSYMFENLRRVVEEECRLSRSNKATYIQCFCGIDRRRTLIAMFVSTLPELFGMHLLGNASYFLQQIGLSASTGLIATIVGVVLGIVANGISFWTLSKFGRRSLTISTLTAVVVLWFAIGISGCFQGMVVSRFTIAGMVLTIFIAGLGVWPASYVVSSEASSLKLRSKTQGLTWVAGGASKCAFDLGMPYVYNLDAANLGSKTGFVFCGSALVGLIVSWFCVPEMKGRSPAEIDRLFEMRLPAWQFKNYRLAEHTSSNEESFSQVEFGELSTPRNSNASPG